LSIITNADIDGRNPSQAWCPIVEIIMQHQGIENPDLSCYHYSEPTFLCEKRYDLEMCIVDYHNKGTSQAACEEKCGS
jgi:hypothetical protein